MKQAMLKTAKKLALDAGEAIMELYQSDISSERKDDGSLLTKADTTADRIIVQGLKKEFPDIPVLSEERKDDLSRQKSKLVWIVDPLDGTKEYVNRNGEFTVNIGLVKDGKPILGVVLVPAKNEMFWGSEEGAFYNISRKVERIGVSKRNALNEMILAKSRSHSGEKEKKLIEKNRFKAVISSGSSLKGCLIAQGIADVYYRFGPTNEWDICAMHAVIDASGGMMTDLLGKEIKYNKEDVKINGFMASNGQIHKKLIEIGR